MLSSSKVSTTLSSAGNSSRHSDGSLTDGEDIFMTIDTDNGTEFFAVEPPRALDHIESFQKERQISVDPISLQGSTTFRQASFRLVSPPVKGSGGPNPLMPSPPTKLKFMTGGSLPSSASSSPTSSSGAHKTGNKASNSQYSKSNLSRMQSAAMDDSHLAMRENETRRSRSLGQARVSNQVDDFDIWMEKSNHDSRGGSTMTSRSTNNRLSSNSVSRKFSKPPLGPSAENHNHHQMSRNKSKASSRDHDFPEDGFKCGKLCLFLPRKGSGKEVRSNSSASTTHLVLSQVSQISRTTEPTAISRTVSMERFDCGSWSSTGENEVGPNGESTNLFFDLPMELLRCSVSDMQSPVTAAFVFDDDNDHLDNNNNNKDPKGVLKGGYPKGDARKSQDSMKHVRFSTSSPMSYPSSPTSIKAPPSHQASEDFEAFLEAQAI